MSRFVSLLLIPFFVLGQCLPHSHAGTVVAEPDGHALRPHVHLHGHDHAHDDHHEHADPDESESPGDSLGPLAEHDSDAVYFVASGQALTQTAGATGVESHSTDCCKLSTPVTFDSRPQGRSSDPPDRYRALPIYLLTASLRL